MLREWDQTQSFLLLTFVFPLRGQMDTKDKAERADSRAIFDVGEVENVYHEIYAPELDFKRQNSSFK